jgi:hypothetical protein
MHGPRPSAPKPPAERRRRAADRARKARCRRREGLRVLHIVVHERRLVAALRAAGRLGEDCPAVEVLTAEAREVLSDFITRWLKKRPCA